MNRLGPIQELIVVNVAANTDFSPALRGIIVAVAGNIRIQTKGMSAAALIPLPVGTYPADVIRIESSGTTAAGVTGYR